jgi:tyrosine-protein phosphatase YwqE
LLPKFKKSEINFVIPNNVMELEINFHIKLINEDNKIDITLCPGTEIYIKNLDEILEKIQINNINKKLSKLFDLYIEEFKEKNFKILNKFVNYIENFFPILLSDDLKKKDNENEKKRK